MPRAICGHSRLRPKPEFTYHARRGPLLTSPSHDAWLCFFCLLMTVSDGATLPLFWPTVRGGGNDGEAHADNVTTNLQRRFVAKKRQSTSSLPHRPSPIYPILTFVSLATKGDLDVNSHLFPLLSPLQSHAIPKHCKTMSTFVLAIVMFCISFSRQAGVDKRSLLIVNLSVDLCPIYLPLS